jgi:6-phosphogluconate dehydrogenase
MASQSFGIVGLGVMGENLALNIESRGTSVIGFDLDPKKVENFMARTQGRPALAARTAVEFVEHLATPRRILMMVPAGKAVLQAQRDYFGAHTYQRVDKEGTFHTQWTGHKGESVTKA